MVPITIFSLLTVSWAGPAGRACRVSRTKLPLVSVLPANLRWEQRRGALGLGVLLQARPQQSPPLPLHSYLYSSDVPQGTRPRLAVAVTFCTTTWSLRQVSGNVSFSVISFMPVSFPGVRGHDEGRGCGGYRLAPALASEIFSGSPRLCRSESPSPGFYLAFLLPVRLPHSRSKLTHLPCFSHTLHSWPATPPCHCPSRWSCPHLPVSENFLEGGVFLMVVPYSLPIHGQGPPQRILKSPSSHCNCAVPL